MQQSHQNLSNGLQSFADVSPDYELAPVGIGSIKDQADKLAEYGRNGDIYIVHAAEGETVVPMEVLDANPKVRELLFGQMRDMGLDPQEFVVGSELNSINPSTGMPEFFFKKIFRAVKKAVKGVVNIVKKAAPVVLPIAASAFGIPFLGPLFAPGTFGAGFIGGGLGSLAGGKSLKDSFKSGLMSGGLTTLLSGVTGGLTGDQGFGQGFQRGLQKSVGYSPELGFNFTKFASDVADPGQQLESFKGMLGGEEGAAGRFFTGEPKGYLEKVSSLEPNMVSSTGKDTILGSEGTDTFQKASDLLFGKTPSNKAIDDLAAQYIKSFPTKYGGSAGQASAIADATAKLSPGVIRKYGPAALIGAGGLYASGLFDEPEPEPDPDASMLASFSGPTGMQVYRENPGNFQVRQLHSEEAKKRLGLNYDYDPSQSQFVAQVAKGGIMSFPRREALVRGPGTERSDDIPAMLSDGEFVMTSKAVRGASPNPTGNKERDRQNGARNMYAMMRNFEMRA